MFIFIPIGIQHTAKVRGLRVKEIRCEKCAQSFVYLMRRTGIGTGLQTVATPYQDSVEAVHRAQSRLESELTKMSNPAPCPRCGWVQHRMIREIKLGKSVAPLLSLVFVLLVAYIGAWSEWSRRRPTPSEMVWLAGAATLGCAVWLSYIWFKNYNHDLKGKLAAPLIDRYGAVASEAYKANATAVFGPIILPETRPGWLRIDRDRFSLPEKTCAVCVGKLSEQDMADFDGTGLPDAGRREVRPKLPWIVPICRNCKADLKRIRSQRVGRNALYLGVIALIVVISLCMFHSPTRPGEGAEFAVMAFVLVFLPYLVMVVALMEIAKFSVQPVRYKDENLQKGTGFIKLRSAPYTQAVLCENSWP